MSEGYIRVPPDSTGKKMRTTYRTVGDEEVHMEVPSPCIVIEGGENSDVDTDAEQLTVSSTPCRAVLVQADYDNTSYILLGGATTQKTRLEAGDNVPIAIDDVSKIYVKGGAVNQKVNWTYVG